MRKTPSPHLRLPDIRVMVVGLTGIGRHVALQLASLGIGKLVLVDNAIVKGGESARAGYAADDIGQPRIHATAQACHAINPVLNVTAINYHKLTALPAADAVFDCTGSQQRRRRWWSAYYRHVHFFGGAQAIGDPIYIAAITEPSLVAKSPNEFQLDPPWATAGVRAHAAYPLHVASLAAGLLVCDFAKFIAGETVRREIHVNLRDPALVITGLA